MPGESRQCHARTRTPWWTSSGVFPSKHPSIAPTEMSNTPRWYFDPLEYDKLEGCRLDPKKFEARTFTADFRTRNFLGRVGVSRYAANPLIIALSPGYSDKSRFRPWSPNAPDKKSFRSRRKNSKFCSDDGTVDVFYPRSSISGPTMSRTTAYTNLHEWWTKTAHVKCPVAQLLI